MTSWAFQSSLGTFQGTKRPQLRSYPRTNSQRPSLSTLTRKTRRRRTAIAYCTRTIPTWRFKSINTLVCTRSKVAIIGPSVSPWRSRTLATRNTTSCRKCSSQNKALASLTSNSLSLKRSISTLSCQWRRKLTLSSLQITWFSESPSSTLHLTQNRVQSSTLPRKRSYQVR